MKVVHSSYARGLVRGGERQLVLLVEALARKGVHQQVLCRQNSGLHEALCCFEGIEMLPARNPYLDWVRVGDGDVLHAHEARAAYWAGLRGAAFARPYVITRRVLNPLSHSRLTRRVHAGAAAVVGVSRAVCELIGSDSAREGVCIHDAHQDLVCDPDRVREIRQSLGGGPIIGQVAALVDHRKGQSAAIAAFAPAP